MPHRSSLGLVLAIAGPLGKTVIISKAPYSPIADPASPHARGLGLFLAWWVVWLG